MNFIQKIRRWLTSKRELLQQLNQMRQENTRLREKVADLQHAKEEADQSLKERRREKETLRNRIADQKKLTDAAHLSAEQLSKKLAELREENERLQKTNRLPTKRSR